MGTNDGRESLAHRVGYRSIHSGPDWRICEQTRPSRRYQKTRQVSRASIEEMDKVRPRGSQVVLLTLDCTDEEVEEEESFGTTTSMFSPEIFNFPQLPPISIIEVGKTNRFPL